MKKSNKEKAVSGVFWMSIMSGVNIIIKLLITIVLSRLLIPSEFGIVASIQIVISFADIFWMMGVGPAIIQKKNLSSYDIATGNILNIIFGLAVYLIIISFSNPIANFVGIENVVMLRIVASVFIIHSISGVSESLLQREMRFKEISLISVISLFIYGFVVIILAILGYGPWALIIAQITQVLTKTVLSIIKRPINFSIKLNKNSARELMYFGSGHTLSKLINNFALQGDYFVVSRALGSSNLGFYNRAYQLLLVPTNLIGTVIDKVLFPLVSRYQTQTEKVKYLFLNITALISILSFPITIISLTMSEELIRVVLGSGWDNTVLPFKFLIISLFFRMAYKICDSLVKSFGAVYKRIWIQLVYASCVIIGALIGKEWGINGVAISTSIAIFINYIIMLILVKKLVKLEIRELLSYLSPVMFSSLIIGVISYLFSLFIADFSNSLVRIISMTLAVGFLYIISFKYYLIKYMPQGFNDFLLMIIGATSKKIVPNKYKERFY